MQVTWFLPMWRVIGTLRWSKLLYIGVSAVCGSRERSRERFRVSTLHLCEPLRRTPAPGPPCRLACGVKASARKSAPIYRARTFSTKIKIARPADTRFLRFLRRTHE